MDFRSMDFLFGAKICAHISTPTSSDHLRGTLRSFARASVSAPFSEPPWRLSYNTFLPPAKDSDILYARIRIGDVSKNSLAILYRTFLPPSKDSAILYARVRNGDFTAHALTTFANTNSLSSMDSLIQEFSEF